MSDLPSPLTPSDCDLRGYAEWMPLLGNRLFTSSWYRAARKDSRGGIAALKLWWVAMMQCPAGSLPNDEEELCMLADFGEDMRAWHKHRAVAMHGFILCADNRWYHPVVSEQAVKAFECRLRAKQGRETDRERLRRWRAANGAHPPDKPNGNATETPDETRFNNRFRPPETRFETPDETRSETRFETSRAFDRTEKNRTTPPVGPPVTGGTARRARKRGGFAELERRLEAASSPTIEATAEELEHFQATRLRLVGGING
jgi:hypothetical protein